MLDNKIKLVYENSDERLKELEESIKKGDEDKIVECIIELVLECGDNVVDYVVGKMYDFDGDKWNDLSEKMLIKMNMDRR